MDKTSKTSTEAREFKRLRAMELLDKGFKQSKIAELLDVTRGAVSQWAKKYHEQGKEALLHKKSPGRPCRLTLEQRNQLVGFLNEGPETFGYPGQIWTQSRVRDLVQRKFGISYCVNHMRKLLKKLGWSCQKPCVRATQRNEEEIVKWREERWPILKKKALEEGMKIVFVDESGFYLLPFLGKTYAPIGETPIIKNKLSREHLSVISGISAEGGLYKQIWNTSIKGENVVKFLEHLLTHIPGKIMVIWDGASIHRCKAIKEFLSDGAAERIHLERLPGYAPDLNPDEGVWQYLKCVSLKNICFENLDQLKKKGV